MKDENITEDGDKKCWKYSTDVVERRCDGCGDCKR